MKKILASVGIAIFGVVGVITFVDTMAPTEATEKIKVETEAPKPAVTNKVIKDEPKKVEKEAALPQKISVADESPKEEAKPTPKVTILPPLSPDEAAKRQAEGIVKPLESKIVEITRPAKDAHWIELAVFMEVNSVAPKLTSETGKSLSEALADGDWVKLPEESKTLPRFLQEAWIVKGQKQGEAAQSHQNLIRLGYDPKSPPPSGFRTGGVNDSLLPLLLQRIQNEENEGARRGHLPHPETLVLYRLYREWQERGGTGEPNWNWVYSSFEGPRSQVEVAQVKDVMAYSREVAIMLAPTTRKTASR
jgi:hypothetical protein